MDNTITEDMYLLAKKVVAEYEAKRNNSDIHSRNYTYGQMKECFSAGMNRGGYLASVIMNNPIEKFDNFDEYLKNNFDFNN